MSQSLARYDKDLPDAPQPANAADLPYFAYLRAGGDGYKARLHTGSSLSSASGILAGNHSLSHSGRWGFIPRTVTPAKLEADSRDDQYDAAMA